MAYIPMEYPIEELEDKINRKIVSAKRRCMVERKDWKEFKEAGFLWFINSTLHLFGWAIVVVKSEDGQITDAYPARVKFRGFSERVNSKGYVRVTEYLRENADALLEEAKDD